MRCEEIGTERLTSPSRGGGVGVMQFLFGFVMVLITILLHSSYLCSFRSYCGNPPHSYVS